MAFDLIQISEALARNAAKKATAAAPDPQQIIAELRERLAAADAAFSAAGVRIAALEQRLTEVATAMEKATTQAQELAAQAMQPAMKEKPVGYTVAVTDRDEKGRLKKMELIPIGRKSLIGIAN